MVLTIPASVATPGIAMPPTFSTTPMTVIAFSSLSPRPTAGAPDPEAGRPHRHTGGRSLQTRGPPPPQTADDLPIVLCHNEYRYGAANLPDFRAALPSCDDTDAHPPSAIADPARL
ncbi:hypothetical protein NWFMUON74_69400 [Nocardia wallacei]|uniref:Uncharacterized protein n=1 Tax=Nocardia wallacei TaxID=480035 RepID=A0A7G1KV52_9NOCA|nr:hypothetical protein NWFMUON74_69400 [Nocardia wallacei]